MIVMSNIEFDTPANRIIEQFRDINQFIPNPKLPDLGFLRQLSIQGRLITRHGFATQSAPENMITIKPASGQTLFVYSLTFGADSTSGFTSLVVDWGTDRRLRIALRDTIPTYSAPYFDSFVGDGTTVLTVTWTASIAGNKTVTLLGWTENTSRIRDVS